MKKFSTLFALSLLLALLLSPWGTQADASNRTTGQGGSGPPPKTSGGPISLPTSPPVTSAPTQSDETFSESNPNPHCTGTELYWTETITPDPSITTLNLNYPSNLNIHFVAIASPDSQLHMVLSACSASYDATLASVGLAFATSANASEGLVLALTQGKNPTSGASRSASSISLFALLLSAFLIFPKNRVSLSLLFCLACLAFSIHAASSVITIKAEIPSSIKTICVNGVCSAAPRPAAPTPKPRPTYGPTSYPTPAATTEPVVPASIFVNMRVLILCAYPLADFGSNTPTQAPVLGADWAVLAMNTVGMYYDYVITNSTVDLSTYLSTTGTGKYSGIISIDVNLLNEQQTSLVVAYQNAYKVKWAVIASDGSALPGISVGPQVNGTQFKVTIAPEFASRPAAALFQPNVAVANDYGVAWSGYDNLPANVWPCTITDSSIATPVLMAQLPTGPVVAAVEVKMPDGTMQLHYLLDQTAEWFHSRVFHPILVNWINPAGLFLGARRTSMLVQPDDLFLGSYLWDTNTHTNPVTDTSPWYRMSADDLQILANYFDDLNSRLPVGSYVTVEWPTNFAGINGYYTQGETDELWLKSLEIQDKFYYLSHTLNHYCTYDSLSTQAGYDTMFPELANNSAYAPIFFSTPGNMRLWSNNSMINPCVTGLYNPGALRAMAENNITGAVSDESVAPGIVDYEPTVPYHGIYTTVERNGYAGIYLVPRQTLDIDYCDLNPEQVTDEYNTVNPPAPGEDPATFEDILALQRVYAMADKSTFRHDPYMMHQTNGAYFLYNDPIKGTTYNASLISLFIDAVLGELTTYHNLPIITYQMDNLVNMYKARDTRDACNLVATLGINTNNQVVNLALSSSAECEAAISGGAVIEGPTVRMDPYASEMTAWVAMTPGVQQSFFVGPLSVY